MEIKRNTYTYYNLSRGIRRCFLGAYITKSVYTKLTFYCENPVEVEQIKQRLLSSDRLYDKIKTNKGLPNILYAHTRIYQTVYNLGVFCEDMLSKDKLRVIKDYEIPNTRNMYEHEYLVNYYNEEQ